MCKLTDETGLEKLEIKTELDRLTMVGLQGAYVLNEPIFEPVSGLKLE